MLYIASGIVEVGPEGGSRGGIREGASQMRGYAYKGSQLTSQTPRPS